MEEWWQPAHRIDGPGRRYDVSDRRRIQLDLGLTEGTARTAREVADVRREQQQKCASIWNLVGQSQRSQRRGRALRTPRRAQGSKSLTYASALNNLGLVYQRTGSLPLAIDAYERAWAVLEQIPVTPAMAPLETTRQTPHLNVHANLGLAYWQQGDLARATRHVEAARAQMTKEGQPYRARLARGTPLQPDAPALVHVQRAAMDCSRPRATVSHGSHC